MKTIHHLDALLDALALGERELCTPPHAMGYLGAGYLAAMVEAAKEQAPAVDFILWCDCGNDPAHAMAGLRAGLKHLTIDVSGTMLLKLQQMGQQVGGVVKAKEVA